MPSATLSRQNRGRWKPFYMSTGRAHKLPRLRNCLASAPRNTPSSKIPRLRLQECLAFTLRNFLSAKANLLCQRGRCILSSAAGASAEQTSAAVGRQNACPSSAVLQPFRGRRQFEYAVRHTFPAKSRPLEAILYVHRPRSQTASPPKILCLTNCPSSGTVPLPELPRFRNCLASASGTVPLPELPPPPELPRLRQGNYQKRALIL